MKAIQAVVAALFAAIILTSVAAAGPEAARQRVAINMKLYPQKTFVLLPLQAGPLELDTGTIKWTDVPGRKVMRYGQVVTIYDGVLVTLTGKRGTLRIRDRNEWVAVETGEDAVAIGTWKVVRGTGQYAGIVGKGRNGHAGLGNPRWYARYEGFLTSP
jgi:hypothetical protein